MVIVNGKLVWKQGRSTGATPGARLARIQSLPSRLPVDRIGPAAERVTIQGTTQSLAAVSYTHLDVYKRQVIDRQPSILGAAVRIARRGAEIGRPARLLARRRGEIDAVSVDCLLYTSRCV